MFETGIHYFGARNGYDGFTSYFDEIFKPSEFSKIYILKGGPGTGKSTILKKLEKTFLADCNAVECIRCSSDKNSYDGLILEKNGRRIAYIDGTAPHMTDPTLPVACEEIINLEVAIDETKICHSRERLEELYKKKKDEYQLAYHFLLVCGEIDRNYSAVSRIISDKEERDNLIFVLDRLEMSRCSVARRRLYSCFGKDGFCNIDKRGTANEIVLFNKSSRISNYLTTLISRRNTECELVLNCFDGSVEQIEIPSLSLSLCFREEKENEPELIDIYRDSLKISKSHFEMASAYHFEMEKYYGDSLNFEILDEVFEALKQKTKLLLSIS